MQLRDVESMCALARIFVPFVAIPMTLDLMWPKGNTCIPFISEEGGHVYAVTHHLLCTSQQQRLLCGSNTVIHNHTQLD